MPFNLPNRNRERNVSIKFNTGLYYVCDFISELALHIITFHNSAVPPAGASTTHINASHTAELSLWRFNIRNAEFDQVVE